MMMCKRILLQSLFCLLRQLRTVSYYASCWVNIFSSANYIMLTSVDNYFFRLQFSVAESWMTVWVLRGSLFTQFLSMTIKIPTDSSTEFGWNPILILQIRTALDRAVNFNECITVSTTGRACTPSCEIKAGYCLVPGTASIRSTDAADVSGAQWLAEPVIARCPINGTGCRRMRLIDSQKQPMSADMRAPHHLCSVLNFRLLMGVYFLTVHGRSLSVSDR